MAQEISSGKRPPIPFNTLASVLIASRFTCCVCHDTGRSVVVHHIEDWAKSRDHSCDNLAILCLEDHDKAHKSGGHTQNLTPDLVRQAKRQWEEKVAKMDTRAILDASAVESASWWLFNHIRLFGLAADLNIELSKVKGFTDARRRGLLDDSGLLQPRDPQTSWMYEGGDGIPLHRYVTGVLRAVLEHLTVYNVSDDLDRSILAGVIHSGQFIFLQGTIYFQTRGVASRGPGQTIIGTRRVNGVEISFTADRWEATANSVWGSWLKGRQDIGCLLRVMTVGRSDTGAFHIGTTAIAIGAALDGLKTREYANAPYRRGYDFMSEDDLGADEDEFSAP